MTHDMRFKLSMTAYSGSLLKVLTSQVSQGDVIKA